MRNLTLSILTLLISISAYADTDTKPQTIRSISTGWSAEGIFISLTGSEIVEGCEWARLRLNNDHTYYDQILTLALSAFHAESKVVVRVSGCTGKDMTIKAISLVK